MAASSTTSPKRDREDISSTKDDSTIHDESDPKRLKPTEPFFPIHFSISTIGEDANFRKPALIICRTEEGAQLIEQLMKKQSSKYFPHPSFIRDLLEFCAMVFNPKEFEQFLAENHITLADHPELNSTSFLRGFPSGSLKWEWIDVDEWEDESLQKATEINTILKNQSQVCFLPLELDYAPFCYVGVGYLRKFDKENDHVIRKIFELYIQKKIQFVEFLHPWELQDKKTPQSDLEDNQLKIQMYLREPHISWHPSLQLQDWL